MVKIRNGFVSNSSSSSFIVINNKTYAKLHDEINNVDISQPLRVPQTFGGETEFGWEKVKYEEIGSKINFAYIQAEVLGQEYIDMLERVLLDEFKVPSVEFNITDDWDDEEKIWGYIDHQSSASEGENTEIFDNEAILKNFLFTEGSYIQGGNDNE